MAHDKSSSSVADLAALGQMFEQYRPRLLVMLQRRIDPVLRTRIDAEDILHQTLVLAAKKWEKFKRESKMRDYPWLYQLARDCLFEAWRKNNRARRDLKAELPWPSHSSVQMGLGLMQRGDGPSTEAAKEEMRQRMRQTLELLKEKDREILWMRHYDQLAYAEIADVLDVTENTAAVRYVRALEKLKDLWTNLHCSET